MNKLFLLLALVIPQLSIAAPAPAKVANTKTEVVQKWASKEDQLKGCLSDIYTKQNEFKALHNEYSDSMEAIKLYESKACKNVNVFLRRASSSAFTAEVAADKAIWIVNTKKEMTKIR